MIEKKNETITLTNKNINKQIKILISTVTKNNRCRKICEYLSQSWLISKAIYMSKKLSETNKAQYQQEEKDKGRKKR